MQVRIRFLIRMVWGANWPSAFMIRKVMSFSHICRVTQQNLSKIFCLYHIIVWIITQTRFHIAVRAKLIAIIPSLSKMNALFMRLFVFISRRLNFALAVAHSKWLWMIQVRLSSQTMTFSCIQLWEQKLLHRFRMTGSLMVNSFKVIWLHIGKRITRVSWRLLWETVAPVIVIKDKWLNFRWFSSHILKC